MKRNIGNEEYQQKIKTRKHISWKRSLMRKKNMRIKNDYEIDQI